jgi:hypothetical protein
MTRRAKVSLAVLALLVGVYSLLRLGFLAANLAYFEDARPGDVAGAFLHGVRFDVAALVILNCPLLVLYNFGIPRRAGGVFNAVCLTLFMIPNVLAMMLNVADYGYYPMMQRRLLYEPFDRPAEVAAMVPQWFQEYPVLCVGVLAAGAGLVLGLRWIVRRIHARIQGVEGSTLHTCISGLVLAAVGVLGVRGGVQEGILRPADAFKHSAHAAVGYLTLNTTYTVLLSGVLKPIQTVREMPHEEAAAIVADMLTDPDETRPDPAWPLLRERRAREAPRKRNVAILLLESWTGANVGPHLEQGRTVSRTPAFDALAKDGLLFTNFLASGQKSNEAIPSLLSSVPSLFRRPVIGSREELTRLRGLGSILKEQGWATSFHYGAEQTIMGFDSYSRMSGFDVYRSEADFPDRSAAVRDGRWGIFDHLFYADTLAWLDRERAPFLTMVFSLSPHDPYKLPPDLEGDYAPYADETGYQRCLRYSDWSLGKFFEQARTRPWFSDTVFVITADHTRFSPPNDYYRAFQVPLLLYAPGFIAPGVNEHIGFHPDLLPTVLDLLDVPARHASMGRSLLAPGERFAVTFRDRGFAIFDDRYALLHDLRSDVGLFEYRTDGAFAHDISTREPGQAARLRKRLLAYLQIVTTSVQADRVWPGTAAPALPAPASPRK